MSNFSVYCHTNKIDGKKYVGITKRQPKKRWLNGKGYCHNEYFWRAINKYGWEEFTHEILFTDLSQKEAEEKEKYLIAKWHTTDNKYGYNIKPGGNYAPMAESSKKKISEKIKQYYRDNEQARLRLIGYNKTRVFSQETKDKIRKSRLGKKLTSEQKMKLRETRYKRPVEQLDKNNAHVEYYDSILQASQKTKISRSGIGECCRKQRKSAGGYFWRFINEK